MKRSKIIHEFKFLPIDLRIQIAKQCVYQPNIQKVLNGVSGICMFTRQVLLFIIFKKLILTLNGSSLLSTSNRSPRNSKLLALNDYLFIDGYRKVLEYRAQGRLKNINTILPVVEFRIKKFAGHKDFKRVNFHVIFSDGLTPEIIQSQFLNGLMGKYQLSPGLTGISWSGIITGESLADLGKAIKKSVTLEKLLDYGTDLEEGFNNLNLNEEDILSLLQRIPI